MDRYDSIIVGAGHNGLVCAAYLARGGQRVLVLESAGQAGGLARRREFHPGFNVRTAHTADHFSQKIVDDLQLGQYGLWNRSERQPLTALARGAQPVVVSADSISGIDAGDAGAFAEYRSLLNAFAAALAPFWATTMPRIGKGNLRDIATFARLGLNTRRLGKDNMREFFAHGLAAGARSHG